MSLHRSHGKSRPAVARPDELPVGVPASEAERSEPVPRRRDGRIASSEAARELGRRGGKKSGEARSEKNPKRWGARLGLGTLLDDPRLGEEALFRPFQDDAEKWFRAKCEELASTVGGGVCSAGVTSIVRTAAWERAFSAYLFELGITKAFGWDRGTDKAGKPTLDPRLDLASLAAKLGDSSRQNLLAAHELCAREAMARKSAPSSTATSAFASKYEEVLRREADAYQSARKALEAKGTSTTEAPEPTDTRGSVSVPEAPVPATATNVTAREQATTAAPIASPAPSRPSPAASSPAPAPSTPASNVAPPSTSSAPKEEAEVARLRGMPFAQAKVLVMGQWFGAEQTAENKWNASGRRGRRPLTPRTIPFPLSKWLRNDLPNEVAHAERHFGWIFETEKNA